MKTILVIEDTPAMRENISEILQLAPYQVVLAANGKEGIERARQTQPDLILCDIKMPELDGFGVLHILRQDPTLADVPFIFLTAKAEAADFRVGMNLGANDYLTKPFDDHTLLNAVALRLKKDAPTPADPVVMPTNLDHMRRAILGETHARLSLCDLYPTTQYNRKHRLFTVGSWPTALYFIRQGKGKVFTTDAAGNEYITSLIGSGELVGYLALLEDAPYAHTAELLEDAQVCTIPKTDFMALIDTQPEVANQFIRLLARDVTQLHQRLLNLAYQSVRKRVAEALLMVQRKFYPAGVPARSEGRTASADRPHDSVRSESVGRSADVIEEGGIAEGVGRAAREDEGGAPNTSSPMTLSRDNWSYLVGASTETVIRVLSDFRAEGLIEINASEITLLDIDKLTRLKR